MEKINSVKLPDGNTYAIEDANALNKQQITNCLLEVPQDIKLELNNGVLTLKAGSKVYDGNGLFAEITNDVSVPTPGVNSQVVVMATNGNLNTAFMGESVTELPANASTYKIFYNTTDKKCYFDTPTGWLPCSFPIALATGTTTNWTSIDQVFNGFGYIGSTVYALPNIKCLMPNGRNEDGSLNNIELVTDKILSFTDAFSCPYVMDMYECGPAYHANYAEQPTKPSFTNGTWFNNAENIMYRINNGVAVKRPGVVPLIVIAESNAGKVKSIHPRQTFSALDGNTPHIVDTYRNGNSWYRVWSDGWCEQGSVASTSSTGGQSYQVTLLKPYNNNLYNVTTAFDKMAGVGVGCYNTYFIIQTGLHNINFYAGNVIWSTAGYIT